MKAICQSCGWESPEAHSEKDLKIRVNKIKGGLCLLWESDRPPAVHCPECWESCVVVDCQYCFNEEGCANTEGPCENFNGGMRL